MSQREIVAFMYLFCESNKLGDFDREQIFRICSNAFLSKKSNNKSPNGYKKWFYENEGKGAFYEFDGQLKIKDNTVDETNSILEKIKIKMEDYE